MAPDDWGAILYLLQNTDANVLGISLVGDGEATCVPGVDNILRLVTIAGHDPLPVACANSKPLSGNNVFPKDWRNNVNKFFQKSNYLRAENIADTENAVDMMKELLMNSSEPVSIIVTGPTSNVAQLVRDYPEVKEKIAHFYLMGGAIETDGNMGEDSQAEWNFYIDPVADNIILNSGVPVTLSSLDYTNNFPLDNYYYEKMMVKHDTPAAEFLFGYEEANSWRRDSGNYLWDQSTAVMMMNESMAKIKSARMCVSEESDNEGAIIQGPNCPEHEYGVRGNKTEVFTEYWQVINKEK
jgi:pyrimidine-specific ribonucleoside hydrolase